MTEREHDQREKAPGPKPPAEPLLPERSKDDTDVGWSHEEYRGESGEDSNDERLRRERPPHW